MCDLQKNTLFARERIPTKTITIRDRDKPWFNSGIKREMEIRDSLHKKIRKQPNINNICQRNKVNDMIIHAKQQFFLNSNDFLDENSSDPKLFWSLVKKLMGNVGRSCTMPPLLDTGARCVRKKINKKILYNTTRGRTHLLPFF